MVEISIGLGIILSLVLSEALGVTAGGIIVPGYIALFLHQYLKSPGSRGIQIRS